MPQPQAQITTGFPSEFDFAPVYQPRQGKGGEGDATWNTEDGGMVSHEILKHSFIPTPDLLQSPLIFQISEL